MVKSEVTMSAGTRRRYTEEFKKEAVQLVRESAHPVSQVARDLGIPDNVLTPTTQSKLDHVSPYPRER